MRTPFMKTLFTNLGHGEACGSRQAPTRPAGELVEVTAAAMLEPTATRPLLEDLLALLQELLPLRTLFSLSLSLSISLSLP